MIEFKFTCYTQGSTVFMEEFKVQFRFIDALYVTIP